MRKLAAILYPDFELLDLYGPLEMVGTLKEKIEILTVAEATGPVSSYQGPATLAEFDFATVPACELLLLPGGLGTVPQFGNDTADQVATYTEYQWHRDADTDPFVQYLNQAPQPGTG